MDIVIDENEGEVQRQPEAANNRNILGRINRPVLMQIPPIDNREIAELSIVSEEQGPLSAEGNPQPVNNN